MEQSVGEEMFNISCKIFGATHLVITKLPTDRLRLNHIFCIVFNGIQLVTAILLNFVAILTIKRSSQLYNKPCYFVIFLQSVIDMATGALGIPLFISYLFSGIGKNSNCVLAAVVYKTPVFFMAASTCTLCAMNVERYVAILHPYAYSTQVTKKRLVMYTCFSSAVHFSVIFYSLKDDSVIQPFGIVASTYVFLLTAFVYARLYLVVKKSTRSLPKIHVTGEENMTKLKLFLKEIKQAKCCFVVVVCYFVLSFFPSTVSFSFIPTMDNFEHLASRIWIYTLALLNSSVNSVIFFWTHTKLRKEAAKMFKTVQLD